MHSARRAVPLLVLITIAALVAMESAARAEPSGYGLLPQIPIEIASNAFEHLRDWLIQGYAKRPAVVIGLGTIVMLPVLAVAGMLLHRRNAGSPGQAAFAMEDVEPPAVAARLAFDACRAVMLPAGRDLVQIGRMADNDVCIEDDSIQHYHAVIERLLPAGFAITDVSGLEEYGLRINGEPCLTAVLANGDLVEIGRARMRFEVQH